MAGRRFVAAAARRLRPRVTEELKKRGREDLATDSNARPKDESEED